MQCDFCILPEVERTILKTKHAFAFLSNRPLVTGHTVICQAWNENELAGQTVPHIHFHMIPRTLNDINRIGHDPRQDIYKPSAERPLADILELQRIVKLIEKNL